MSSLVKRPAGQISAHTKCRLDTLIVARKLKQCAVTHSTIEELGFFIARAHFQIHVEYTRYHGAFFQPLKKLAADAGSSMGRSHSEKVQVCVIVAVTHDGKAGNLVVHRCNEYVDVGSANTLCNPFWCPTPIKPVFDQIAREVGNAVSLYQTRQSQG